MKANELQRTTVKNQRCEDVAAVEFYKACQVRFFEENRDPERRDVQYFVSSNEAKEYASELKVEIGYMAYVDRITIQEDEFLEYYDEDGEFELDELDDYKMFYSIEFNEEWSGGLNDGDDVEDAIIVDWSWERHVGYCRNFHGIRRGRYGESENDLANNADSTFRHNEDVLLTSDKVKGLSDEELLEAVREELYKDEWKWNSFRCHPTDEKIALFLDLNVYCY